MDHTAHDIWSLSSFSYHTVFEAHIVLVYISTSPLSMAEQAHCVYTLKFIYAQVGTFLCYKHFSLNIISVRTSVPFSLRYMPRGSFAGLYVNSGVKTPRN